MSITLKGLGSAVDSVNGKTGIVVLSPGDLGAESAGAASAVIVQHEAAADPHPQYLTETEADAKYATIGSGGTGGDPAGTAAALLAAHESAADPHPQYLTQSEGDALYQPIGSGGDGTSETIRTPVAVAPLTGTTEFPVDGTLQASPYAPLYSADTREFREFQIDTASGDFTSPISVAQVDADTWAISPEIPDNTDLKWRCRDKSVKGDYSEWSEPQAFKTYDIYVVTPIILSPAEGGTVVERDQPITSSEFQIVNAIDTHGASYWTIKNSLGAVVYQTGRDTVNLTSWQPPAGVIVDGESVTVEVVYESSNGLFSEPGVRGFVGISVGYGKYLAVAHTTTPFVTNYGVDVDQFDGMTTPSVLPAGNGWSVAFSPDGTHMTVAHPTSPYITIYKRSGDKFTKLANPSVLPTGTGFGVAFSPEGTHMAVAHDVSPYITIYKREGDVFTKLANPSVLPTRHGRGVAFSQDGTYMAVTHEVSPRVTIYKREGDTFTKLADPSVLPAGNGWSVAFSPDGTHMTVTHEVSPYITIYKREGDVFTKLANPSVLPASTGNGVAFSPDGTHMTVTHSSSPRVTIYKRSGDTFTKLADPSVLPASTGNGVAFSGDGAHMAVAHNTSPYVTIYKREGDVFTKLADPSVLPTSIGLGVAFWPSALYPYPST